MNAIVRINTKSGLVITPNASLGKDGKQYGFIKLEQETDHFNDKGFLVTNKRTALIKGEMEVLTRKYGHLKDGSTFPVEGKIVVLESTTIPYEGAPMKLNPSTGEVLMYQGNPIYRITIFTSVDAKDVLLAHDKDSNVVVISANADESAEA